MEATLVSIPTNIRSGFEDPEGQFVSFMDYMNESDLKEMNGTLAISQMQTFKVDPVPLQETQFDIEFDIKTTRQLENFLDHLLIKRRFSLNVQQLVISRVERQSPHVILKVALLLPAKIDLPQFAETGKETAS